jgi:hypothetical protein
MDSESDPGDSSARWSLWDRVGPVSVRPALPRVHACARPIVATTVSRRPLCGRVE